MQITIPFKTPSVNHLHNYWRGHITLSKEARNLKDQIREIVGELDMSRINQPVKVNLDIFENWRCKNGEYKRSDLDNRGKFLIDAVFDALGIDDKLIFVQTFRKIQDTEKEQAIITIEVL